MPEDINFLPKELRPHKKEAPKEDEGVLLSEPLRERRPSVENKPVSGGRHWWRDLAVGAKKSGAVSAAPQKLRDDRKNLLSRIRQTSAQPDSKPKQREPQPKPLPPIKPTPQPRRTSALFAGARAWFSRPRKLKAPWPEKHPPQPDKTVAPPAHAAETKPAASVLPPQSSSPLPVAPQAAPHPQFHQAFIGTNLIKGQEFLFFNWRKSVSMNVISIIAALLLVAGAWWYASRLGQSQSAYTSPLQTQLEEAQDQNNMLTAQVAALTPLRRRAQLIQSLLDKHIYWTNFFTYLEQNTLPGVYYLGFAGDALGKYNLKGRAPDFAAFVAQSQVWQQETRYTEAATIQSMQTVSAQQLRGDVSQQVTFDEFELELSVDTAIFYK